MQDSFNILKTGQCNSPYKQIKEEKLYDLLLIYSEKAFDEIGSLYMIFKKILENKS